MDLGLLTISLCRRRNEPVPEMVFAELKVPRRPQWDATTTAEDLNRMEKESFMEWRRDIAMYVPISCTIHSLLAVS
jgi:hypothetical protein